MRGIASFDTTIYLRWRDTISKRKKKNEEKLTQSLFEWSDLCRSDFVYLCLYNACVCFYEENFMAAMTFNAFSLIYFSFAWLCNSCSLPCKNRMSRNSCAVCRWDLSTVNSMSILVHRGRAPIEIQNSSTDRIAWIVVRGNHIINQFRRFLMLQDPMHYEQVSRRAFWARTLTHTAHTHTHTNCVLLYDDTHLILGHLFCSFFVQQKIAK